MTNKQQLVDKIQTIARRVYASKMKDSTLGVTPNDVNFDKDIIDSLTIEKALSSRINTMGTAPENVSNQIQKVRQELQILSKWSKHNPVPKLDL